VNTNDDTADVIVPALTRQHPIEVCSCPENFTGSSCEACLPGLIWTFGKNLIGKQKFEITI
jgi:hypothetical protein